MTRVLKTSGFLGLATMMVVGLYQYTLLASGQGVPGWLIGGHAHLVVLSILAIVMGFAVDAFDLADRLRTTVTGLFLAGQWLLPGTIWIGEGADMLFLMPTAFLWGLCLIAAMLVMAWQAATTTSLSGEQPPTAALADD
jgi:hypothetical protein